MNNNGLEIYQCDVTKLIDGKSLDEVIQNLTELRNSNYGCEVIRLVHPTNMRPVLSLYHTTNILPDGVILNKFPDLKAGE